MAKNRRRRRDHNRFASIQDKANRVLQIIFLSIAVILLKIWHLSVIQHDDRTAEARRPRQRTLMEPTTRATIRDRFNIPLALNQIKYQAGVNYSHLREIPSVVWERDPQGKKVKRFKRKEYILELSRLLGKELALDPERIEDLIHSKAALYFHIPFILKDDLSETEYYRLKYLAKNYPGICVLQVPKRVYPYRHTGCDIIGYMGSINKEEYEAIIQEIKELKKYLRSREDDQETELPQGFEHPMEVRQRLKEIEQRAYTINDYVGKAGIEAQFEYDLRGYKGKKNLYTDAQGNYLRELPGGRLPQSGQRLLLSISRELQEYIEQLLTENEAVRSDFPPEWIKGGAIVVMDPHKGDVLAMGSYPRFDPNDFIPSGNKPLDKEKQNKVAKWFETEAYIANLWNQKIPFDRELYDSKEQRFTTDAVPLDWENYLDFVLPHDNPVRLELDKISTIGQAVSLLQTMDRLLYLTRAETPAMLFRVLYSPERTAYASRFEEEIAQTVAENPQEVLLLKERIDQAFDSLDNNYDRLMFLDLCRISIDHTRFTPGLLDRIGKKKLETHRRAAAAKVQIEETVEQMARDLFHELYFLPWKQQHGKAFILEKRKQEKAAKTYARPYIEYFDREEKKMFREFWKENKPAFITAFMTGSASCRSPCFDHFISWNEELSRGAHCSIEWRPAYNTLSKALHGLSPSQVQLYLSTMRSYQELDRPLWGNYRNLRSEHGIQLEKHLASAFYPAYGFGYCRSYAFRQAAIQGSIFKIVTAYTALIQSCQQYCRPFPDAADLNPLTIIDRIFRKGNALYVGETLEGKAIPRIYKGGRLPKSLSPNIGKIEITKAIATSSNPYFSLLASDYFDSPWDLATSAEQFSYGAKTGIQLPGEISGEIPNDLDENKTGLYLFAIGHHSLVVTPLQTAVMLSCVANGGKVLQPRIVTMKAGREWSGNELPTTPFEKFPYEDSLALAGIDFPLFTAAVDRPSAHSVIPVPTEAIREIPMPAPARETLISGMEQVMNKISKDMLWSLSAKYKDYPEAIQSLKNTRGILIGKTSSAECMETINLDGKKGIQKSTHIWFGGISFADDSSERDNPELVIVVYLRFGGHGKDAAPLAAQIIDKWHEIKQKHETKP